MINKHYLDSAVTIINDFLLQHRESGLPAMPKDESESLYKAARKLNHVVKAFHDNEPCAECEEPNYLYSVQYARRNTFDVRLDPENAQIDIIHSIKGIYHDQSINIKYCPFCGRELREDSI